MFAFTSARAAVTAWRGATARPRALGALLTCALLSACAAPQRSVPAAEPHGGSAPVRHQPALTGYQASRPADPKPWRERNDAVAPKEKAQ
jgi:hypothetical protein